MTDAENLARSVENDDSPSPDLPVELRALWLARKGRWHEAHDLCQVMAGPAGAWIHAWLHRQEGDIGNARYWYGRADKPAPDAHHSLDEEWFDIARTLAR